MNNLDLKPCHNGQNVDQMNDHLFHFRTLASFYDMPYVLYLSLLQAKAKPT